MKVKVLELFRDKYTKEIYQEGQIIEFDDESRVDDLVSRGLVETVKDKTEDSDSNPPNKGGDPVMLSLFEEQFEKKKVVEALKSIGENATNGMKDETILKNVAALDEEKTSALMTALGIE